MKPSEAAVPQMAPETIPQAAEWSADNTSDLLVRLAQEKGLGNLMQRIAVIGGQIVHMVLARLIERFGRCGER